VVARRLVSVIVDVEMEEEEEAKDLITFCIFFKGSFALLQDLIVTHISLGGSL
jgi:hypothetical protein